MGYWENCPAKIIGERKRGGGEIMDKMWISRYRWSVSDDGTLSGSVFLVDCDSEIFFYLV